MPPTLVHPGVYVEEVSFRTTIRRLGTARAVFVGTFPAGPFHQPRRIASLQQLDDTFGHGATTTIPGRSIDLFARNGGKDPIVVRIRRNTVDVGLRALTEQCDLLCIPETATLAPQDALAAITAAREWAGRNGVFYLLDPPRLQSAAAVSQWLAENPAVRDRNTAAYWPQVTTLDGTLVPPGGLVAGVFARTDTERGVWKAPAGTEANLRGVSGLSQAVADSVARAGTGTDCVGGTHHIVRLRVEVHPGATARSAHPAVGGPGNPLGSVRTQHRSPMGRAAAGGRGIPA